MILQLVRHWLIPGCNGQVHRRGCTLGWCWIVYTGAPEISERNRASVAQKIQTLFIDDLDGSAAEGTVRFGLDGTEYEIDLNAEHAQACGTRWRVMWVLPGGPAALPAGPHARGRRASANGLNTTEVREWAKAQGIEVKDRGRVPAELVVKFKAATGTVIPDITVIPVDGSAAAAKPQATAPGIDSESRKSVSGAPASSRSGARLSYAARACGVLKASDPASQARSPRAAQSCSVNGRASGCTAVPAGSLS